MTTLRRHPYLLVAAAFAIAAGAAVAVAAAAGFGDVGHAFGRIQPGWLALIAGAQVIGVFAYAAAYRAAVRLGDGPRLSYRLALRLVAAGFGAFTVGGGFALDYEVLEEASSTRERAQIRVLALGAVEYAVLAPAACIAAIVMLIVGSHAQPSLLWPWALAVPIGFALAFTAVAYRDRLARGRRRLDEALAAVGALPRLARSPQLGLLTYGGMAVYWAAEIVSLWAALRTFGVGISVGGLIVAYATGYAATRRTLPLGGAGATEALMAYALHWVGVALAGALAAVVAYRLFNFVLSAIPALWARGALETMLLDGSDEHEEIRRLGGIPEAAPLRRAPRPRFETAPAGR